jgi:hypothetical protein
VPRPTRLARAPLAAVALGLAAAALAWCCHRSPDLSGWDESRLAAELGRLGCHTHPEPRDRDGPPLPSGVPRGVLAGVYVARDEPADWDEVASRPRCCRGLWRGSAAVWRWHIGEPLGKDPEYLRARPWVFYGDPEVLDDIASRLGVPR